MEDDEQGNRRPKISKIRAILMAFCIGGACLDWGLLFSVQPSFYPSEAEKKGAKPSQYGFVFGIVHLAALITAPIFAIYGSAIGPKLLYNIGGFAQGLTGIAFGFLDNVENVSAFLGLSYFLRAIDGVADAASWGAVIGILMELYPDRVATILSWTETAFGLGYTIGPALGSSLYKVGGFRLPFVVVGVLGVSFALGLLVTVPKIKPAPKRDQTPNEENQSLLPDPETNEPRQRGQEKPILTFRDIGKSPSIFMPYVDNAVCFAGIGFIESMLEPYMKSAAGATQDQVGYNFLLMGLFYMVFTPLIGYICDRISYPAVISLVGNLLMALGLTLIGPASFVPMEPSIMLTLVAGAIVGIAQANTMVSSFARAHAAAMEKGFSDHLETYLLISGMWSFSFYFGNFIGPSAAGFILEHFGFRKGWATSIVFAGLQLIMLVVNVPEVIRTTCTSRNRQDYVQIS